MAEMARILTVWSGGPSAPGISVMNVRYDTGAIGPAMDAIRTFWAAEADNFPSAYQLKVQPVADLINAETGNLTGQVTTGTPPATVGGTSAGAWAAGVGSRVTWHTAGVVNGHRVTGRTFLVPLATTSYQNDGSLVDAARAATVTRALALISSLDAAGFPLVIYTKGTAEGAGEITDVTSASVPDVVAVLRGRRV